MAKSLPPLTWFRTFEAAARHLNFTAAADEIGLTQSAVSQQVKLLETRLNVSLFTRRPRGLTLTDEGRKLLPQVGSALQTLAQATDAFDTGPAENLLTIAASVSVAQWIIAPNLKNFTSEHPDVRVRFLSAIWPDDFLSARADVEIRFGSQKQVGHNARLLTPNSLVALKSPTLDGEIQTLPLIEAVGTSDGWSAWSRQICEIQAPTVFADSYGMALHLASQGNGVALATELLAINALHEGILVKAHDANIPAEDGYFLSVVSDNKLASSFAEWLTALLV